MPMRLEDLDYFLPPDRIAQHPAAERDASRLLVVHRGGSVIGHHFFRDLPGFLHTGDLLILNDTRVLPARLLGKRENTGGKWEGLFLHEAPDGSWEMLCQTGGRPVIGEAVILEAETGGETHRLLLVGRTPAGRWLVRPEPADSVSGLLAKFGRIPLPQYIRRGKSDASDRDRYQTVYADRAGAIAAPTAGLHFTRELFAALSQRGVDRAFVTLHVGPGTFQPVQAADPTEHRVQAEWGEVSEATAAAITECKARGGRVIAVGTTAVRVLETAARHAPGSAWAGFTDLTICPPFTFQVVDALVTNFHLPRSSLLMLVAAFTGLESMRAAYAEAVNSGYRFYSYGDAMLII
jgi:S-adenosylmethionine:tRNA ribosyltransferase-isomerase